MLFTQPSRILRAPHLPASVEREAQSHGGPHFTPLYPNPTQPSLSHPQKHVRNWEMRLKVCSELRPSVQ